MKLALSFLLSLIITGCLPQMALSTNSFVDPFHQEHTSMRCSPTVQNLLQQKYLKPAPDQDSMTLVTQAATLKNQDRDKCASLFFQASRLGNAQAMIELATLKSEDWSTLKQEGSIKDEVLKESLRWAILGYQVYYVQKKNPYGKALSFFNDLTEKLNKHKSTLPNKKEKTSRQQTSRKGRGKTRGHIQRTVQPSPKAGASQEKSPIKVAYHYLTSPSMKEKLTSSHALWQNFEEPFFDPNLAHSKRIFLLSLFEIPLQAACHPFSQFDCATPEKFITLMGEYAISQGSPEQEGWDTLAQFYFNQGREKETLMVLNRIGTPAAFEKAGFIFLNRSKDSLDFNGLQRAIAYFERAGTANGLCNAGVLLEKYFYNNFKEYFPNERSYREKAFSYYARSGSLTARLNMAEYIRYGYHGEAPSLIKAKRVLLKLLQEIDTPGILQDVTKSAPSDFISKLCNNLGSIYHQQYYQQSSEHHLKRAISCYERSQDSIALNSLGYLYLLQGEREQARIAFQKSNSVDARLSLIGLEALEEAVKTLPSDNKNNTPFSQKETHQKTIQALLDLLQRQDITIEEHGKILSNLFLYGCPHKQLLSKEKKKLKQNLSALLPHVQDLFLSCLYYAEGKKEKAILQLSRAALVSNEAYKILEYFVAPHQEDQLRQEQENLKSNETKHNQEFNDLLASMDLPEIRPQDLSKKSEGLYSTPLFPETEIVEEKKEGGDQKQILEEEKKVKKKTNNSISRKQKKEEKKEQKRAKKSEKYQKKFHKMLLDASLLSVQAKQTRSTLEFSLRFSFLNKETEKEFEELKNNKNSKFEDALQMIQECPWATQGGGDNPKFLKVFIKGTEGSFLDV